MGYGLGIDIGTSRIAVAVLRNGEIRTHELVGDQDDPTAPRTAPDTGPASVVGALTATLRAALASVVEQLGDRPDTLVLTYQARQGRYGRDLMETAARGAGLDGFTVISDLQAAATHYANRERLSDGDRVVVYDLGASACTVGMVSVTGSEVNTSGTAESVKGVGGADFDKLILAAVDRELAGAVSGLDLQEPVGSRALDRLSRECEQAKIRLSEQESALINALLPYLPARSSTRVRQSEVALTREAFEAMIIGPLETTLAVTRRALSAAQGQADRPVGLLLIGGSARIPLVGAMLSTSLGFPVHVDPEAADCAALGAALVSGAVEPVVITDVAAEPGDPALGASLAAGLGVGDGRRAEAAWPAALLGRLGRGRRAIAVAVAVAVLFAGASYLALGPGSPIISAAGPAPSTGATRSGPATPPSPSAAPGDPADPAAPRGTAGGSAPASIPDRTGPASTRTGSTNPSGAGPSNPATIPPTSGAGTTQPPAATATSVPPTADPPGPTAAPTSVAPSPGLVIRIGDLCYDLSRPQPQGGFAVVPCP